MININENNLGKYITFVVFFICVFSAYLSNVVSVALPEIARSLGMSNIIQNWTATIFLLVIAMFSIPFGKLSGKWGLKKSVKISLILMIIGSIGSALANSQYILLFFRAFQGIGGALLNVASIALIGAAVPAEKRGTALGISIAGVYIGISFAPVIGGILTYNFGWESIFSITVPFLIIAYILMLAIKDEWNDFTSESLDKLGCGVYAIGIMLFIFGFTSLNDLIGIISLIVGAILLIGFTIIELKVENPVFNVRLFKNKKFLSANIASLISYFATFVITFILNYHFQYIMGLDSQTSGIILIICPLMMTIVSPFSGRLSDKITPQILSAIGMTLVTIAIGILCFLDKNTSILVISISMFLQGVGFGIFSSPNTNAIMGNVPKEETPSASASLSAVRVIGQTMSLGMLTVIFAIIMGNVPIIPKYYPLLMQSSQMACIIAVIACIIAILASLVGVKSGSESNI